MPCSMLCGMLSMLKLGLGLDVVRASAGEHDLAEALARAEEPPEPAHAPDQRPALAELLVDSQAQL